MFNLTRPVLIAAIAGVVAIAAIGVAAWRLSSVGGPLPGIASDGGGAPNTPSSAQVPPGSAPVSVSPAGSTPSTATSPSATTAASSSAATPSAASAVTTPSGATTAAGVTPHDAPAQLRGSAAPAGASQTAPGAAARPSFDVVRIDPAGEAVIAGRAEPRAQVALTLSGKPVAEAQADADGQFVLIPPKLPSGDHVLGLRARGASGESVSEQTVAIAVPARGERETVAAMTAPDKPTVVLSQPSAPGGGAGDLRIASVEAQQGGALFASGVAPPGSTLRLYLNESYVASVDSGADGKWSVRVERGMAPGGYRVRADRVGPDGRAIARVEAPFDYPTELAKAPSAKPGPVAAAGTDASVAGAGANANANASASTETAAAARPADAQNAVVEELRTARVERGDSLWRISRSIYGEGVRYTHIYDANSSQIRNPDLIYPGQVLVVPKQDSPAPPAASERRR